MGCRAVCAFILVAAWVFGMFSLATLGTNFSPFTCIFAVTKFLAVEAAQWVWNI